MDKIKTIAEIQGFLEGYNNDLKYLVNVETDNATNVAECVVHEPQKEKKIIKVKYEPFMYMKDLSLTQHELYFGKSEEWLKSKQVLHGITITKLETGNQKRLVNGYSYKITSKKSYNDIIQYLSDGGLNPYEKLRDTEGNLIKDDKNEPIYLYRDLFFAPRLVEQFLISTQSRLFKGFEDYDDLHKLTFDIETTGLRYQISRIFAIGVRDNKGFEVILEVDKKDDDEAEIKIIQDFFNLVHHIKPAIISGFNSEEFDFEFILGRAKILDMNLDVLPTGLKEEYKLKRRPNTSVKYGNTAEKFTATEMWGYSIIDIMHAAKRTAAINSDIKETKLKYLAKFEKVAKDDRVYIDGEDNMISKMYWENKIHLINNNGEYVKIPENFQETGKKLYKLQVNKEKLTDSQYLTLRNKYLSDDREFVKWFKNENPIISVVHFIGGKNLVKKYLLDDLWETEQIDNLYNQSSFLLAKLVPTTYQRICTMGTASIWNLLLTAWSYENDLAIPQPDEREKFSGGLARCFKSGYSKRIMKIDYASLYPMIQLEDDVFPIFDITGVIKKMLLYLTTTRNIYKKLAKASKLNNEEVILLKTIDHDAHEKYLNGHIMSADEAKFKIKQLPIKILNNSLFGALGSAISFNWSDNLCAARITCTGRLHLRHGISWFNEFGLVPLLAVTDGINFQIPDTTTIRVTNDGVYYNQPEGKIEEMWKYNDEKGVGALIEKFNSEEMRTPFMSVDNDGESVSCLNLSRINYATLNLVKDKKTGKLTEKIKLTGNTIKSKVMPEYIEDFIDNGIMLILHGKGKEFVEYYYDYVEDIFYEQIPLKKIASKSKIKTTLEKYKKRGKDKNGREKGMQAHMELLIQERERIAEELFEKHKDEFDLKKSIDKYSINDKMKLVANYMPQEPELDSTVYYVNTGYVKSHGDSKTIKDRETGEERFASSMINRDDLIENPNMKGKYNVAKYLDAFNKRVEAILVGFDPEIRKKILVKINKKGELIKNQFISKELELKNFDLDDYDEAMHLENKEVIFWNKYGYDPRLVWDGFKMYDNDKVYFEIYDHALNHLNNLMIKAKKPLIKSINEKVNEGDMVLIKDDDLYHVGLYNGVYVKIIRENVEVPKSQIEIELDEKHKEEERNIQKLKPSELTQKTEKEKYFEEERIFKEKAFELFKEKFNLSKSLTWENALEMYGDDLNEMFGNFMDVLKEEVNMGEPDDFDVDY